MGQVTTSRSAPSEVCTRLLGIDDVFYAFAAQGHRILCDAAKDLDLARVAVTHLPHIVKTVILATPGDQGARGLFGTLRTTIMIFDRITLVVVHSDDLTYGVTVHNERATSQLIEEVHARIVPR